MHKRSVFKNLLKRIPNDEQSAYERKLIGIMKRLKIQDYKFNWDRTSCYVEFFYNEEFYRLEHSVEKAQKRGIVLRNGLDCLMELTLSLEDLCGIIGRGLGDFETWIAGMKQSPSEDELAEYQEELEIRYKSRGRQHEAEYYPGEIEEPLSFRARSTRRELESNGINQRPVRDGIRF